MFSASDEASVISSTSRFSKLSTCFQGSLTIWPIFHDSPCCCLYKNFFESNPQDYFCDKSCRVSQLLTLFSLSPVVQFPSNVSFITFPLRKSRTLSVSICP